jgi:hypothetical protein
MCHAGVAALSLAIVFAGSEVIAAEAQRGCHQPNEAGILAEGTRAIGIKRGEDAAAVAAEHAVQSLQSRAFEISESMGRHDPG